MRVIQLFDNRFFFLGVLVRRPYAGRVIVDVLHKVGESSCIYRERQCLADAVVILVLIGTQWPPSVICTGGI